MAEKRQPQDIIYNTQVKGVAEQAAGMPPALDLGVAGAVRPWPGLFPSRFSLWFPLGSVPLRGRRCPRFGARRPLLAGP